MKKNLLQFIIRFLAQTYDFLQIYKVLSGQHEVNAQFRRSCALLPKEFGLQFLCQKVSLFYFYCRLARHRAKLIPIPAVRSLTAGIFAFMHYFLHSSRIFGIWQPIMIKFNHKEIRCTAETSYDLEKRFFHILWGTV